MEKQLYNINILFIAPKFFGYENLIANELERCGARVFYVQENIDSTKFSEKVVNQLPKDWQIKSRQRYFIRKFKETIPQNTTIDYVFGIRMDLLAEESLEYLKTTYPKAIFICYFWDSSKNMRNAELVASYFDRVLTFDKSDAESHAGWIFRPLFFIDAYEKCKMDKVSSLDILFIGSIMPKRAELYLWLCDFCKKYDLKLFTYFYCKTFVFWFNKLKLKLYRVIPSSIVHNHGMGLQEIISLFSKTNVVFDCSSPTQSGLTMRTIECVGARKKMITTNTEIIKYDFYNPNNIFIFDRNKKKEMSEFIKHNVYEELDSEKYEYYSIRGWINTIFKVK